MRNLLIAFAFIFSFLVTDAFAQDEKASAGSPAIVASQEGEGTDLTPIDTEDASGEGEVSRADDIEDQGTPSEESYDENTGLPDVAQSDKEWIR